MSLYLLAKAPMPPDAYFKKAVGCLMAAYKGCALFRPEIDSANQILYPTNHSEQYWLTQDAAESLGDVIRRSTPYLDLYPDGGFQQVLQTIVADARQAHPVLCAAVAEEIGSRLRDFFVRLNKPEDWETLFAVSGIAQNEKPFALGAVRFFILDPVSYQSWNLPNTGVTRLNANLIGGWVAVLNVPALDGRHSVAKALPRVEMAINCLRYGSFERVNAWKCVRLGAAAAAYWCSQSLARPLSFPKAVCQFMTDGSDGLILQLCDFTLGYGEVVKAFKQEVTQRSEREQLVLDAVTWVGQAAPAALNSVRLVLLVTALEVLLIDDQESLGKRSKIARRLAAIVPKALPNEFQAATVGDRLYHLRSECLHTGATSVTDDDANTAFKYVTAVVYAFLAIEPFTHCTTLGEILAIVDPKPAVLDDYSI